MTRELDDLVIVGAGGHGRETLDIVEAINRVTPTWRMLGFVDDRGVEHDDDAAVLARRGVARLGPVALLEADDPTSRPAGHYTLGIGASTTRRAIDVQLASDLIAAVLVHPQATVGSDVHLGPGVLVAAGARITTNVSVGRHSHCNVNSVVSHDCRVGDYVSISPGVLVNGGVHLGDDVFLGTGAIVLPGRSVGAGAIVGAGAVVDRDVAPGATVRGVPAR